MSDRRIIRSVGDEGMEWGLIRGRELRRTRDFLCLGKSFERREVVGTCGLSCCTKCLSREE